jgi:predicted transcriptional regulator
LKPIKIQDIEVKNPKLLDHSKIARNCGISQSYVSQLLDPKNVRKNDNALRKVRNAIVEMYGNNVSIKELQHAS